MLDTVDLSQKLTKEEYDAELDRLQSRLQVLAGQVFLSRRPVVIGFEGWDAAGKGGSIKRLTTKLDPRVYTVWPIAAPEGEDKDHHYLYRFWRRIPPRGHMAVFDRTWYGRVLVERVEGFATPEEWGRAYREIRDFEHDLSDYGAILCKFWLHISPEEQLRRFEERENTPYKSWKLTADDWRNRQKWDQYYAAVDEMLLRTSTDNAPWTVVPAEDKHFGRVFVLRTVVETLERGLDGV